jgi:DNA-binding cell septation regulator SpoVG
VKTLAPDAAYVPIGLSPADIEDVGDVQVMKMNNALSVIMPERRSPEL